jgi:hypothetical protein
MSADASAESLLSLRVVRHASTYRRWDVALASGWRSLLQLLRKAQGAVMTPKPGDKIRIKDPLSFDMTGIHDAEVIVDEVHLSWRIEKEVWPTGEDAIAAADADPDEKAEWYALVHWGDTDLETYIVCSFETELVE